MSVARRYRATSTVLLFQDGPLRLELERAGVRVLVRRTRWAGEGLRQGTPRLGARQAWEVLRLATGAARLGRRADLLYANSPKALIVAALAGSLSRRPVLWYMHDRFDSEHFSAEAIRLSVRLANRSAVRVLANSKDTAATFARAGGRTDSLHVAYYGLDPEPFADLGADQRPLLRRDLGFSERPIVGVFGRLTPWKGQDVVLAALVHVPAVDVLFVGDPSEDPEYAAALERRAAELGLSRRVRFAGFRADVPRLMQAVDLVVHSATAPEPFGRVVVEAMLAGRPVIATGSGGVPEIVEPGVNGWLVAPGDVPALAAAIRAALADPEGSAAIARTARKHARARFSSAGLRREMDEHVLAAARGDIA